EGEVTEITYFEFSENAICSLYRFSASYDDGTTGEVEAEQVWLKFITPAEDWRAGGENKARFTCQGKSCEVSVPVKDMKEAFAHCSVLEEGKEAEVLYEEENFVNAAFFLHPQKAGTYRITVEGEGSPTLYVCDMKSEEEISVYMDANYETCEAEVELREGGEYLLSIWAQDVSSSTFRVRLERNMIVTALEATLKNPQAVPIYGMRRFGSWDTGEDDDDEDDYDDDEVDLAEPEYHFGFAESLLSRFYRFTAVYENGGKEVIDSKDVSAELLTSWENWALGGENKVRFTYQKQEVEVSVPVSDLKESLKDCQVLELGKSYSVDYKIEDGKNGVFLYQPQKDGYVRFASESEEGVDPILWVYTYDTYELVAYDDDGGEDRDFSLKTRLEAGKTYVIESSTYSNEEGSFTISTEESGYVTALSASLKVPGSSLVYGNTEQGEWKEDDDGEEYSYFSFFESAIKGLYELEVTFEDGRVEKIDGQKAHLRYVTDKAEWVPHGRNEVRLLYGEGEVLVNVPVITLSESQGGEPDDYRREIANPGRPKARNTKYGVKVSWTPVEGARRYEVYRKVVGSSERAEYVGYTWDSYIYDRNASPYVPVKYYVKSARFVSHGVEYYSEGKSKSRYFIPLQKQTAAKTEGKEGKVKLSWTEQESAKGYQVRYAKGVPTTGGTVVELENGGEIPLEKGIWYFTYRFYVEANGKRFYSPWSKRSVARSK
ncbi:MAG: hypothetical protein IIZ39_07805, partial [Blautia sp.]|nr:hypothetical protein [Blautia sp.]